MADREFIRPPQQSDFKEVSLPAFRYMQEVANRINSISMFHTPYVPGQDITDQINNSSQEVIVIPSGIYTISGDLNLTNKTLTGLGVLSFTSGEVFFKNTVGAHYLSGLTFINTAIYIFESTDVFVNGCTIKDHDSQSALIVHTDCSNIHITNNKIMNIGKDQLYSSGIFVAGYWDSVLSPCTDVVISGNILIDAGQMGIESWGYNNRVIISDNIVKGCTRADGFGISVSDSDDHVVSNNIVEKTDLPMLHGIEVALSTRTLVQGNVVRGTGFGVDVNQSVDCLVDGNLLYDNVTTGIRTRGSGHVVKNNYIKDCQSTVYHNWTGTNIIFKNNTGNSVRVDGAYQAIINESGTVWVEGNHITALVPYPVLSHEAGAVLTAKDNYFGDGGGFPITSELNGGKVKLFGHGVGDDPVTFEDAIESGTTFTFAQRFIHSTGSTDPFVIRIKYLQSENLLLPQRTVSFMIFWASRETATPKGGFFIVSFGSSGNYDDNPALTQIGSTVTAEDVAYDGDGYPYWDFSMVTNHYTNQALVYAMGEHTFSGYYVISAV